MRLAQIINNLIANAYKYGDNFSPIRVRASRLDDGFGRIEIANAGPGIPAAEREAVFLPFRPVGRPGPQGAGRRPGAFHRQAAGGKTGRPHRFRERSRPPDPVLDRFAAGRLTAASIAFLAHRFAI